jgi:hypothetical protein
VAAGANNVGDAFQDYQILDRGDPPHDLPLNENAVLIELLGRDVAERLAALSEADLKRRGSVDPPFVPGDPMPYERSVLQFDFLSSV